MATVRELVGVYHANGTLVGEVTYWINARLGRGHCALCDITHGVLREKPAWRACRDALPVPMRAVHLDERSPAELAASADATPCVLAVTDEGTVVLLGPDELDRCAGSPPALVAAIDAALDQRGLRPAATGP